MNVWLTLFLFALDHTQVKLPTCQLRQVKAILAKQKDVWQGKYPHWPPFHWCTFEWNICCCQGPTLRGFWDGLCQANIWMTTTRRVSLRGNVVLFYFCLKIYTEKDVFPFAHGQWRRFQDVLFIDIAYLCLQLSAVLSRRPYLRCF